MRKIFSILTIAFLISNFSFYNLADAKNYVSILSSTNEFIIFKAKRGLFTDSDKKWNKKVNQTMNLAKNHCNRFNKNAYWFRGLSAGLGDTKAGLDMLDSDDRALGHAKYRLICATDTKTAVQIFGKGVPGYRSELSDKPNSYYKNDISNWGLRTYLNSSDFKIVKKDEPKKKKKTPKTDLNDDKIVPAGSGSGFFISNNGHIITNHHVIEGCNITKVNYKGNISEGKILAVDKVNDIAIVKTKINPSKIFSISREDVTLLEDVIVAGYPLGKKVSSAIKTHKGVVTALAGAGDNYSNFQTDATINPGNSGGPIINQKGNIVGIAVATWVEKGVQGVHFGIKSSTLKTFASANDLRFIQPNYRDLSNKDLGKLITEATVYLECHMTVANIKKMLAAENNRKAFFKEFN